jgi:hypothetical protein
VGRAAAEGGEAEAGKAGVKEGLFIFAFAVILGVLWSIKTLLEQLLKSLGGLRWQLEQMDERQQRIAGKIHAISDDTNRMPKQPRYDHLGGEL